MSRKVGLETQVSPIPFPIPPPSQSSTAKALGITLMTFISRQIQTEVVNAAARTLMHFMTCLPVIPFKGRIFCTPSHHYTAGNLLANMGKMNKVQ